MLIGKNWKIESSNLNIILSKKIKRIKKGTKETYDTWQIIGYYASVKNALHELVNQSLRDTELTTLTRISAEIDKLHQMIEALQVK